MYRKAKAVAKVLATTGLPGDPALEYLEYIGDSMKMDIFKLIEYTCHLSSITRTATPRRRPTTRLASLRRQSSCAARNVPAFSTRTNRTTVAKIPCTLTVIGFEREKLSVFQCTLEIVRVLVCS